MIKAGRKTQLIFLREEGSELTKLEVLRQKINSEDYLHEAIQRIALIISNELLDIPQGGSSYERQRRSRQWRKK
ncbi:MAG: hypothetical protein LBG93_03705 [Treponema sp.]|jgi:hypothetical protein|nr:hypothetical protein [Treponema sp.]